MKKLLVLVIAVLFFGGGFYLYFRSGTLPFNKTDNTSKTVEIKSGESLESIINTLHKEDLIRNKLAFYLVIKMKGLDRKLQAGDFRLSPAMSAYDIADALTHGTSDVWVTLIEGTRREEMAEVISRELSIPEVEIVSQSQEGYLFPETYRLPKDASAASIIGILTKTYNEKFTQELKQLAAKKGLTEKEVLTLASIVEKEAKTPEDKRIVAGILLKRLQEDWPLQVDATIQYALGYQPEEKTWWKKYLSFDDLEINSPYNSYKNKGLPPTPISNPGIVAIEAVVNADPTTPYWFYISDKKGVMHYAKTQEEHEANIAKYLQ